MKRLEGKVALVTGAARGQGRSHAIRLAREGADVIAVDACAEIETVPYRLPSKEDLAETARLVAEEGVKVVAEVADVRDLEGLRVVVDQAVSDLGRLDVVCANAGITGMGRAHELSEIEWSTMVDINLNGVWRTCKVAIPHLLSGGAGGSIVLTSSVAGLKGIPNIAHYSAAKHGVVGLMRVLAQELGADGIRVNAVCPTQVGTEMILNDAMYGLFRPDLSKPTREDFAEMSRAVHVLDVDWVDPEDVSNVVAFLASEESRYITGVALPIDAGNLVR